MQAAQVLAGVVVRTPLLESSALNEQAGGRLLFKPETLQVTGSFKFRGAYNHISRLDASVKKTGVLAYSSGNHAQGSAAAAYYCGTPALIVMPEDAPEVKNIVLFRPIKSMIEFKQIIGRGTRLFDGKDYFTIFDFVDAHDHFQDSDWDGEPEPTDGPIIHL